jgi:muramoyltetrapeptide carboxypeptidase
MSSRRSFLARAGAASAALLVPAGATAAPAGGSALLKPPRLRRGETIGLMNPVGTPVSREDVVAVTRALEGLGMRVKNGPTLEAGMSGIAVDERRRAAEMTALFADPEVRALVPVRGGWGSARLLPHLDYALIRRHPKVLMGFSDVAALLLGVHARTGLVTFHGPMGNSSWDPFTVAAMRRVLFDGEATWLGQGTSSAAPARGEETAWRTLTPGRARGRLLGGNLTVVSSMVGSPYLGASEEFILFLEEVREPTSEVDRMLTQLDLSGVLARARGLVFGQCTRCAAPAADRSLTLEHVLLDHVGRRGIPAWEGALIGHGGRQLTLPIGVPVEIDASRGTIRLLEPAVA